MRLLRRKDIEEEAPPIQLPEDAIEVIYTSEAATEEAVKELRRSNQKRIEKLAWLGKVTRRLNEIEVDIVLEGRK